MVDDPPARESSASRDGEHGGAPIERPLGLGEVLAETIRIYRERPWASLGLGAVVASAFVIAFRVPEALGSVALTATITLVYAAAARLVSGDSFTEAWAQVGLRLPILAVLAVVVVVPFALAARYLLLLLFAAAWLGVMGFAIPVAMLERDSERPGWFWHVSYSLRRALALARAEYFHAIGVVAAFIVVYVLFGTLLARILVGFADTGSFGAVTLVQLVLAPFFFLGLSVLYFEQTARALSSRGRSGGEPRDPSQ